MSYTSCFVFVRLAGTSEDLFQDSEGREGSEPIEEHQFSDLEESDDDDDNEDDEDEEEEESQDEPSLKLPEAKHPTPLMHSSGGSPTSQEEGTETASSLAQETASSSQKVGEGQQGSSCGLETRWSADSSDIAVCHSILNLHRPALTSTEQLASAERESVTRPPMSLAMELSASKDTSPRKRWSPSQDSSRAGGSSRPMLARKHLLTKNETSPKRFSPTGEMSPLRCLSPGRGLSPCPRVSPRREASPLRCASPRLELSPSRHLSPRRELSPRAYLPPEGEASSPSREMPSGRYLSLKKTLPPSCSEAPRYPSPGKEDAPGTSRSAADDKIQSSYQAQHGILSSMPLPHRFFGKNVQLYESKLVSPSPLFPLIMCCVVILIERCNAEVQSDCKRIQGKVRVSSKGFASVGLPISAEGKYSCLLFNPMQLSLTQPILAFPSEISSKDVRLIELVKVLKRSFPWEFQAHFLDFTS